MATLQRMRTLDEHVCRTFNRGNRHRGIAALFALISRLGDGWVWYVAIIAPLVVMPAHQGWRWTLLLAISGMLATALYRLIKGKTRRPRPSDALAALTVTVPPLDRYSFPSGHTLHAVMFAGILGWLWPVLAIPLAIFALAVATSRLILGLHWPSDVVIGALIGGACAWLAVVVATALGMLK